METTPFLFWRESTTESTILVTEAFLRYAFVLLATSSSFFHSCKETFCIPWSTLSRKYKLLTPLKSSSTSSAAVLQVVAISFKTDIMPIGTHFRNVLG